MFFLGFLLLNTPAFSISVVIHGVKCFIPTVGPPVFAHARCLDAAKLAMSKDHDGVSGYNEALQQPVHRGCGQDHRDHPLFALFEFMHLPFGLKGAA